ncbi:hypothetical protein [Aliidongia dinghuensis]|uniref:hypothetical protein n=1 Tax=Aliidongia dinghuensis TaxID=1867774 RepID=UPI00166DF42A|nr:hypothetical protein [Aliidongia dinghuensis]
MGMRIALLLAGLLLLDQVAFADDAVDPRFVAFIKSDAHRAAVLKVAAAQAQGLPAPCAAARYRPAGDVDLYRPPQFDGGGRIIHGLWREQVLAEGCGTMELLNIFSLATASGEPELLGGLPGTTRADLVIQKQALPLAAKGLPPEAAQCRDVHVVDTVLAPDAPADRHMPWHETWTVLACDKAYPVPLNFTPSSDGATIALDTPPPHS